MKKAPASAMEYAMVAEKGIPKRALLSLSRLLRASLADMAGLLNISPKTIARKKDGDLLDSVSSSLSIELSGILAQGLAFFGDADKLRAWLYKENRALGGQRPFDLMNTPTGLRLVSNVLGRLGEGVYT